MIFQSYAMLCVTEFQKIFKSFETVGNEIYLLR